jgi:hypothetical protein
MLDFCFMQCRMNTQKEHAMTKKPLFSLLAILFLALAGTSVAASNPVEPAVEPATPPAAQLELDVEFLAEPLCTESGTAEMTLAATDSAPVDVLTTDTSWWYGICWTSCFRCQYDYQCPWGETCQFNVQCP